MPRPQPTKSSSPWWPTITRSEQILASRLCPEPAKGRGPHISQHDQRGYGGKAEEGARTTSTAVRFRPGVWTAGSRRSEEALGRCPRANAKPSKKPKRCLMPLGRSVFEIGHDPVQANVAKITGNFLIASAMEAMGEAVALVRKYGRGSGEVHGLPDQHSFRRAGLQELRHEDRESRSTNRWASGRRWRSKTCAWPSLPVEGKTAPLPLASLLRDHMLMTISHYGEDVDWSMIAKLAAEHAGLKNGN